MSHTSHGGEDHLAPVIPLFGTRSDTREGARSERDAEPSDTIASPAERVAKARDALADAERIASHRASRGTAADGDASTAPTRAHRTRRPLRHLNAAPSPAEATGADAAGAEHDSERSDADPAAVRAQAEEALVRRLRARQLSVSEARSVLRENDLDRDTVEDVIDEFERRSYLDDRSLASLLVASGSERKGQGRVALSRSLAQRGIPRDIIAEALEELPDDDAERALEFARSKASGMTRLDFDTALRRLHGQLARRGYGGSVAMDAARTALREAGVRRTPPARPTSGVRFVDSD